MKKKIKKLIAFVLCFSMFLCINHVFAGDSGDEISIFTKVISTALNAILWVAYAIALGCLLFFGIKYLLSGANDKAKIKGILPQYIVGLGLIVCSFTIATWLVEAIGNNNAEEIINVAKKNGDHFVVSVPTKSNDIDDEDFPTEMEIFFEWMKENDPALKELYEYEKTPYVKTTCPVTRSGSYS